MGQDVAPCPALGADSSTCLPEFTGFAEELPRVEWTCSSPSALAIVSGISVTAGQENLGRPAGGEQEALEKQAGIRQLCSPEPQRVTGQEGYRLPAQQGLRLLPWEQSLGFSLHLGQQGLNPARLSAGAGSGAWGP